MANEAVPSLVQNVELFGQLGKLLLPLVEELGRRLADPVVQGLHVGQVGVECLRGRDREKRYKP